MTFAALLAAWAAPCPAFFALWRVRGLPRPAAARLAVAWPAYTVVFLVGVCVFEARRVWSK